MKLAAVFSLVLGVLVHFSEPTAALVFGQDPGFQVMITKKGFDYGQQHKTAYCVALLSPSCILRAVSQVFGPVLRDKLNSLSFSDIHDSTKISVVGKIEYSLTRFVNGVANVGALLVRMPAM